MDIRFWGTCGSLAKPGPITLRYGGNTSCVEVRADDGALIILDCGTGIHGLGQALLSAGPRCQPIWRDLSLCERDISAAGSAALLGGKENRFG